MWHLFSQCCEVPPAGCSLIQPNVLTLSDLPFGSILLYKRLMHQIFSKVKILVTSAKALSSTCEDEDILYK